MVFSRDSCQRRVSWLWSVTHHFDGEGDAVSVNTDQTSHMEKKIRDFEARSLPLGRFAEVSVPYILRQSLSHVR